MSAAALAAELAALPAMDLPALRARWRLCSDKPVPKVRQTLLRLALAYELQATVHGALSPPVQQRLAQVLGARTRTAAAQPGTRLVREWNGALHTVLIEADGVIRWNGQAWRSLSQVARAITGTRWSGPAFFGLKHKLAA